MTRNGWTAVILAALTLLADQVSKHWILFVYDLPARGSSPGFGPMDLTMVWNQGVSFGLLRAETELVRWSLTAFSLVVAVVILMWARRADRGLLALGLGAIAGGAVGNAIDRIRFGAVADFLDFKAIGFPWVFNVADAAINVGVALILIDALRRDRKDGEVGVR